MSVETFTDFIGVEREYIVPDGYNSVRIECWGAWGGTALDSLTSTRAPGGYTCGTFPVTSGDTLYRMVGGRGGLVSGGEGNGICNGGSAALNLFTGGAGSYVSRSPLVPGINTASEAMIIAGGGGGDALNLLQTAALGFGGLGGGSPSGVGQGLLGGGGDSATDMAGQNPPFGNGEDSLLGSGGGGGRFGGGASNVPTAGGGGGSGGFRTDDPPFLPVNLRSNQQGYIPNTFSALGGCIRITPLDNPCVAEGSLVALTDGRHLPIEQLRAGDLVQGANNQPTQIQNVVRFRKPSSNFIAIESNAFGTDLPKGNLNIRKGHPLMLGGVEIMPEDLLGSMGVTEISTDPTYVYTIITEKRDFVKIQGLAVGTWGSDAWDNNFENSQFSVSPFDTL